MSEDEDDHPLQQRIGPVLIDWPRSVGYFGGVALAIAYDLIAPELAMFVAAVPLVKLLERKHATNVEKTMAAVFEGAAKPLGGDAESTVRPSWLDDEQRGTEHATHRAMDESQESGSERQPREDVVEAAGSALERMWRFARRHPALSILGTAGLGLIGGLELAGGVLIGAGVAAALRGRSGEGAAEPVRDVRERARSILSRAPHEVRERARAVVDAARGKMPERQSNGHGQGPRT